MFIKRIDILTLICLVVLFGVFAPLRLKDKYNIFMADPNWGLLEKSQTSDETIEEAIDRLIEAHDDDANAHIGAGKSLNTHKTQTTIDHPADSIIEDKVKDGEISLQKLFAVNRILISCFESLDGWLTSGTISQDIGNINIRTTAVINNLAVLYSVPSNWQGLDWDKDFFWQSTIKLAQVTNQQIYFGMGTTDDIGAGSGAGFYIDDDDLYVYHAEANGGGLVYTKQIITGITLSNWNVYRIIYDESAGTIKFYINGVLKHTFSTGLPTTDDDRLVCYQIKTTEAVIKYMYVSDLLISIPK